MEQPIATVSVENTFFNYDSDYDYVIPTSLASNLKIGQRVNVPFGRGNIIRKGIILKIYKSFDDVKLKEIISLDNNIVVLSEEMISLALWLKERCFCSTYECLKLMLPRGIDKVGDKTDKMIRLITSDDFDINKLTQKQQIVVDLLLDVGSASVNEVCEFCSVGITVLKNLVKNNICEFFTKEVYRNPFDNVASISDTEEIILSAQQQKAYSTYKSMMDSTGGYGLLFGVTGSGKTKVYLKLIDDAIKSNKDVIVMVPEISLTPQMLSIFHKRYGKKVAVFHSGLSLGERNDEYKRVQLGEAKIVLGTRSAIFAPCNNLGLIVMDEEQEQTYKSERTPRYNAKDIAKFRAKYNKALFLMTSATPSVESYSAALNGKYKLCELSERYGNAKLPEVITVDMKEEIKSGNYTPISQKLKLYINENLKNKKQTILLINRRGYNTFIACNDCGHVITCPNCSISLTYHSYNNKLMCHYCGYEKELDNVCPQCGSNGIRYSGYGTQRIQDELEREFPNARILRVDADTTSKKFSHQRLFDSFANGEYDILVGTQMVAKGLDFPNVTLVGVVNADNSLYDENYNSQERTFDLITQVIGRSGRRDGTGKAVIQTINPNNNIIEDASNQDYKSFYETEIGLRKMLTYPPFCDIYSIFFVGKNENYVALCAKTFFENIISINKNEKIIALGPSPSKISKINNNYRYRLALKCKNSKSIRKLLKEALYKTQKIKEYKDVSIGIDLNPYDLM